MTTARALAGGALAIAAIAVIVLLLSGGSDHTYRLRFQNAGQLVKGDDVQVGGRRIGSVDSISLTPNDQAEIGITVQDGFAPLHEGTTAIIRATSLSGIANRYVALTPGPNSAPKLKDGALLGTDRTTSIVDLDQLFNTFDARTRRALQRVIRGSATQYAGAESRANAAAHFFNPAISTSARLVNELDRDQQAFTDLVVQTARVSTALAARRGDLTNLVTNANQTASAIAAENTSFDQALRVLPPTLRRANTTFVNLRAALGDLTTLVNVSKPATRRLAPFLAALRPLVAAAIPTIHDLRVAIHLPGPNNDLIDLTRKLPRLARVSRPVFARAVGTLRQSQPVIEFIRPYVPELEGWFHDFGEGASTYDANGHYARIQPIFNAFSFNDNPLLGPILTNLSLGGNRLAGYEALPHATGNFRRCPGAASQRRPDGGNPWRDTNGQLDCDPSQVLPGEYSP